MGKFIDLTGEKFGRITILDRAETVNKKTRWRGQCDCGIVKVFNYGDLANGKSKSCGCLKRDFPPVMTHGQAGSRTYQAWARMKQRCNNPNIEKYKYYGGKGIRYCVEWELFENFYADMGECKRGFSLERIDYDKDYEPSNCEWIPIEDQNKNKSSNRRIAYKGERKLVSEWARGIGITTSCLSERIDNGWDLDRAMTTPPTRPGKPRRLVFKGEAYSLRELSRISGLKTTTISERISRGWSVEKAATTPPIETNLTKIRSRERLDAHVETTETNTTPA